MEEQLNKEILGKRLKMLRNELGYNQKKIQEKIGIAQGTLSLIENGKGGSLNIFIKLLNFYSRHFNLTGIFSDEFKAKIKGSEKNLFYPMQVLEEVNELETVLSKKLLNLKSIVDGDNLQV